MVVHVVIPVFWGAEAGRLDVSSPAQELSETEKRGGKERKKREGKGREGEERTQL